VDAGVSGEAGGQGGEQGVDEIELVRRRQL
jgi:hypothetical protein